MPTGCRPGSARPVPAASRRRPPVRPRRPGHEAVGPAGRPGIPGARGPAAFPGRAAAGDRRGGRRPRWRRLRSISSTAGSGGRFVVVGETSGLDVVSESKGMLVVRLLAAGRNAHSAYPWLGDNALVKLQSSVTSLLARYPVATEEVWRTTVTLARIRTQNQARNQVPEDAEALLDIRFPARDADLGRQDQHRGHRLPAGLLRSQASRPWWISSTCRTAPIRSARGPQAPAGGPAAGLRLLWPAPLARRQRRALLRPAGHPRRRVRRGRRRLGAARAEEYADLTTVAPYYRALSDFLGTPGTRSRSREAHRTRSRSRLRSPRWPRRPDRGPASPRPHGPGRAPPRRRYPATARAAGAGR